MTLACVAAAAAAGGLAVVSDRLHAASVGPLLAFHLAFSVLVVLAFPAPRSHAYSALTGMLFLGFWPKFMMRLIEPTPFLEPVGAFEGQAAEWDRALITTSLGVLGVILARGLQLLVARRHHADGGSTLSSFYVRHPRVIWLSTGLIIVGAYAWNTHAAVYVTGVNPRIVLPFKLNIVLAWCYIMAFPLWVAILVGWELERRQTRRIGWLLLSAPVGEAILNAGSLLSRATYLLRVAAYYLATTRPDPARGSLQFPKPRMLTHSVLGLGFAASIAAVMAFRTMIYFGPAPPFITVVATSESADAPAERGAGLDTVQDGKILEAAKVASSPAKSVPELRPVRFVVQEVGALFVDRWTGMEGVLAVTAAPQDLSVLKAVIAEDPAVGTESIYQEVAQARYEAQERFTFLTLAGVIAILAMGGSPWLLVAGMAAISSVLMLSESCIRRITRNEMACSVVAMTSAFMAAQVTFPKLFAVFLLELLLTLGALAALFWVLSRLEGRPAQSPGPGDARST